MLYRGYPYLEMGDIVNYQLDETATQNFFLTKNTMKLGGGMTGEAISHER